MNDLPDAEISRRLALAIGWNECDFSIDWGNTGRLRVYDRDLGFYRYFDYHNPAVIWPIAEWFAMFPRRDWHTKQWYVEVDDFRGEDTAAKAVALAVIKAMER